MIKTKGLVHMMIPVSDTARSREFYCGLLGLELVADHGHLVFCRSGDDYILLGKSEVPIKSNVGDDHRIHQAFHVTDAEYDRALGVFKEKSVRVFKEEFRDKGVFTGRSAYFHDPDGNVIEIHASNRHSPA